MAVVTSAVIAGGALAVSTYQAVEAKKSANRTRDEAEAAAAKQKEEQDKLAKEAEIEQQQQKATETRDTRYKAQKRGGSGIAGTVLTGPMGLGSNTASGAPASSSTPKTLLGS